MTEIDIITIFPEMFPPVFGASILKRAQEKRMLSVRVHDLRKYTHDKRRTVDDRPYGGGPGMVMKPEPIFEAVEDLKGRFCTAHASGDGGRCQRLLMSPAGERLSTALAEKLAEAEHLIIICGHYEGVDDRVKVFVNRAISIGDYVLTGGELPAMVVVDAACRFMEGVIGHEQATAEESFAAGLLEYPQYTRPLTFKGMSVPDALTSGDHEAISAWRKAQALKRTRQARPDLLK